MISTPVIICAIAFLGLAIKEKGKIRDAIIPTQHYTVKVRTIRRQ